MAAKYPTNCEPESIFAPKKDERHESWIPIDDSLARASCRGRLPKQRQAGGVAGRHAANYQWRGAGASVWRFGRYRRDVAGKFGRNAERDEHWRPVERRTAR